MTHIKLGGHRGMGCTDHDFYQDKRDIASLPVENTLESIKAAFENGADYIETDAVMSADGVLFTIHNVVPKDHFFADDRPRDLLNTLPYAEISPYKTGRYNNGTVARLDDVLNHIAAVDPRTLPWSINIEIKGVQGSGQDYEENDYLHKLVKTVENSALGTDRILFSSFSLENIIRVSHALPSAHYGMLFSEKDQPRGIYRNHTDDFRYQYLPFKTDSIRQVLEQWQKAAHPSARLEYLHPEIMTVTPDIIYNIAQMNLGLNVWALFEQLDAARLDYYRNIMECTAKSGVALTIITDYLPEMKVLAPK